MFPKLLRFLRYFSPHYFLYVRETISYKLTPPPKIKIGFRTLSALTTLILAHPVFRQTSAIHFGLPTAVIFISTRLATAGASGALNTIV